MATFDTNSDGTIIMTLSEPVTVNGALHERVTIPKLRGRHLMGVPTLDSLGKYVELAARVVEPRGAVEEMCPGDAVAVADQLLSVMGKATTPKAG